MKTKLKDRKTKTLNNVLAVFSGLLKVALDFGVITVMPVTARGKKVDPPEMEFYEFEEYQKLVDAAEQLDPRVLITVLLGGDAGLRRGEMIALERKDLDLRRGILTVSRSEWRGKTTLPKGRKSRKVPLTQKLLAVLKANQHLHSQRVLCRDDGSPVTAETLKWWVMAAQKKAGLKVNGRKHILRHSFCSHLAMRGANAITIKELAGHQSTETTMRYMHLSPNHKATAISLLDQRAVVSSNSAEIGVSVKTEPPTVVGPRSAALSSITTD